MAKRTLVNSETDRDVNEFIEAIKNKKRQADSKIMLNLIRSIKGVEPKIWGVSIVGFGKYSYQRKNGDEYEWFNVGFSPGSKHLTLYVMFDLSQEDKLLNELGEHSIGKGCLYIKSMDKIDQNILKKLIQKSDKWER